MSQPLKICFDTTSVSGAGYYRQHREWRIDKNPGLSTVEVHHNGVDEDGEAEVGDDDLQLVQKLSDKMTQCFDNVNIYIRLHPYTVDLELLEWQGITTSQQNIVGVIVKLDGNWRVTYKPGWRFSLPGT